MNYKELANGCDSKGAFHLICCHYNAENQQKGKSPLPYAGTGTHTGAQCAIISATRNQVVYGGMAMAVHLADAICPECFIDSGFARPSSRPMIAGA